MKLSKEIQSIWEDTLLNNSELRGHNFGARISFLGSLLGNVSWGGRCIWGQTPIPEQVSLLQEIGCLYDIGELYDNSK